MNSTVARLICKLCLVLLVSFGLTTCTIANDDSISDALSAICKVEPNGKGHVGAAKAIKALQSATTADIPKILEAMDGANKISENWLRSAVNSIVAKGGELPRKAIETYYRDSSHSPMGRLVAFELLTDGNEELAKAMTSELVDDPSLPLRYKAISALITEAAEVKESDQVTAIGKLGLAFNKARDVGQMQTIAKKLDALGVKVNLQEQMGFLNTWHLVGSFDNKEMEGFDVAYGPESDVAKVNLEATYEDLEGKDTGWIAATTADAAGNVDLNEVIGKVKGATVYAFGTFKADEDRGAEIRIGTPNATKVWLNGELVMSNEIYHNSNSIDKFRGSVKLKKGDNEILVKVCQNEQTQPWAQDWGFQLRICDESGKAISPAKPPAPQY